MCFCKGGQKKSIHFNYVLAPQMNRWKSGPEESSPRESWKIRLLAPELPLNSMANLVKLLPKRKILRL